MLELVLARNPDPDSALPYLLWVPVGTGGLVFRTKGTWPRTAALYCHPVDTQEWPAEPDVVERVRLTVCERRGAAIDVVADRGREQRSQIVFTRARGREMVFWQSPRTRKKSRPQVTTPTARAAGVSELEIVIDAHERYPYTFAAQQGRRQVATVRARLRAGDYAVRHDAAVVAAVERKSLPDLVASLTSGRLRFALAELASLPRAAVVVEERYSEVFALTHVRPAVVADGLAELQIAYPTVAILFCQTRTLAEEWTYRYLAAAHIWAAAEPAAGQRINPTEPDPTEPAVPEGRSSSQATPGATAETAAGEPPPSTATVRAWARAAGYTVPDRGRLRPEIHQAWRDAHP